MRFEGLSSPTAALLVPLLAGSAVMAACAGCRNGERATDLAPAEAQAKPPGASWSPARVAELYFSTEVSGYIEPCGCTTKPLGGIQRLATVLSRSKRERVLVDAGNLVLPAKGFDDITREQHLLKSRILARAYRQLGAVALNLAESDLGAGVELLKELQREGAVPLVSANIRPNGDAGPSVARSVMRQIGGVRVGLTGVATPERFSSIRGVTAIEYGPAVRAEVSSLRKDGAEIVIVLAHVGELGARELAAAVPEIDVIIRAPGTPIEREPQPVERVGNVLIAEAGSQGQHIGRLTLNFGATAPERPIAFDDSSARDLRERRMIERKIKAYRMELEAWRVDPTKAEAVKAKEAQIRGLEASLSKPIAANAPPSGPHLEIVVVPLTEDIPAEPEMSRLLAAYYGQLHEMNLEKGDVALCHKDASKPSFVGTAKCAECHQDAYDFWKKTKHARAWETLEEQGKHFDLTCIGCHTVGYQQAGGFCRLKDVGVLKDVGCESCHGPGSVHSDDSEPTSIKLEAPIDTCKSGCHVPDHSDGFVYEKYLREVIGPGHGGR